MGFSLTDLGNIAVGAIERDREITKEDLAIRAENLQANKQILINQKDKKYNRELEEYYKEKKKFDAIEEANKNYNLESIDARTYASQVLPIMTTGWANMTNDNKERMINNFDGKTLSYKLVGSEEEINKKAAEAITLINNQTSKEIKDAKGNSFLINQILGRKEKAEKDIYKAIESKLNAVDTVNMTETSVNQDYVGKEVKVSGDSDSIIGNFSAAKLADYNKFRDKLFTVVKDYKYNENDVQGTVSWAATTKALGTDTKAFITYENNIPKSWTTSGASVGTSMQNTVNNLVQSKTNMNNYALTLYLQNPDYSNLASRVSKQELLTEARTIIRDRGDVTELKGEKVWSMLPTSIVNGDNKFTVNGKTYTLSNQEMYNGKFTTEIVNGQEVRTKTKNSAKKIYDNIVKSYVEGELKIDGSGFYKGQDEVQRAYQLIQDGLTEGNTLTSGLSKYIKEQLVENYNLVAVGEEATTSKVDTNDKSKIKKTDNVEAPKIEKWVIGENDNGEKGLRLDGTKEFITFKKMNTEDIKGLSIDEKKEYDKWKKENNVKGTTFEEIQKNTDENTEAIKASFLDSEGNFNRMKSNTNNRYSINNNNNKKSFIKLASKR